MEINGVPIWTGGPPYLIAEVSCNHCGDFDRAIRLIQLAAGADAVKFQLFTPDEMADPQGEPLTRGPWSGRKLYDLYADALTPREWFPDLFAECARVGVSPIVSVLSADGIAYLETLDCPAYKIPSAENTWTDLMRAAAATGKPVLVSTGMTSKRDVERIVGTIPHDQLILLHCVSAYPTPPNHARLGDLSYFIHRWGVEFPVGQSDHSVNRATIAQAVTLGAAVLEVHIMSDEGPWPLDVQFSWGPESFARLAGDIRDWYAALQPTDQDVEADSRQFKRREIDGRWLRG